MNKQAAIILAKYLLKQLKRAEYLWLEYDLIISIFNLVKKYNLTAEDLNIKSTRRFLKRTERISRLVSTKVCYMENSIPLHSYVLEC